MRDYILLCELVLPCIVIFKASLPNGFYALYYPGPGIELSGVLLVSKYT
jgi:hypothetical protein